MAGLIQVLFPVPARDSVNLLVLDVSACRHDLLISCWLGLNVFYSRRFLEGHNFMPWFQRKRAAVEQEQQRLWRQARLNTDIHKLISKMSEVEIVDSFNAIERHLLGEIQVMTSLNI